MAKGKFVEYRRELKKRFPATYRVGLGQSEVILVFLFHSSRNDLRTCRSAQDAWELAEGRKCVYVYFAVRIS